MVKFTFFRHFLELQFILRQKCFWNHYAYWRGMGFRTLWKFGISPSFYPLKKMSLIPRFLPSPTPKELLSSPSETQTQTFYNKPCRDWLDRDTITEQRDRVGWGYWSKETICLPSKSSEGIGKEWQGTKRPVGSELKLVRDLCGWHMSSCREPAAGSWEWTSPEASSWV